MKQNQLKSGQNMRTPKRRKSLRVHLNEQSERAGNHFVEHFWRRLSNVHQVRLWVLEWVLLVLLVFMLAILQIIWYNQAHESMAYDIGGTYREGSIGAVNSLNPLYAVSDSERVLSKLLFANLVSPDASGNNKGDLAESVTMDESGKIWTLKLRNGLMWSDGEAINADDIIFTVGLLNDESAKTIVAVDFSSVKLEKLDDLTVRFTLPSPYVDFIDSLEFPIVPEHVLKDVKPALLFENEFSKKPVCSGAFSFNAILSSELTDKFTQEIYLNRNDNYYKQNTMLDHFILRVYKNREDIVAALKRGDIHASGALSALDASSFEGTGVSRRTALLNGGAFAFFNTERLSSGALRQAIRQGIDMSQVRAGLDESRYLDYPILNNQEEGLSYPELPAYDLEAARKRVLATGYKLSDNGKFVDKNNELVTLRVAARKQGLMEQVANNFAKQLEQLGFAVQLDLHDDGAEIGKDFFTSVVYPRDYDILLYEVDLGVSADPFVYYNSTQLSAMNFSNYKNSLVDDALLSARMATTDKLRTAKYNYFLKYWANEVPSIGIYRSSLDYYFIRDTQTFSEELMLTDKFDRFQDVQYWAVERKRVESTP